MEQDSLTILWKAMVGTCDEKNSRHSNGLLRDYENTSLNVMKTVIIRWFLDILTIKCNGNITNL